ncbi:PAAR domain-containing protein [Paraliomyxa miuraensis]|uniref:hypothetical protein n=1 Tax=Paraliomyxa miuraensis TaxID=376150 RepID=UPI002258A797|nr:hypothetical protein [Paraliomyxa miuraensis]MCX4240177.1 hypothetical protein [Paraliomyxa miuraensis]
MTLHPEHVHPATGVWDVLVDLVQAIRLAVRFRGRKRRIVRSRLSHSLEWLDDDRAGRLRALLEPVLRDAARCTPVAGRPRPASEPAAFELLADLTERPEHLLSLDVDDAEWCFDGSAGGCLEQWNQIVLTPAAGFAARVGDPMLLGNPIAPGPGSPNVFIGGRPALRSCDSLVRYRAKPESYAGGGFVATQTTVEINGFPALRVGDYVSEGPHGVDAIADGCPSVVIGRTPEPRVGWCSDENETQPPPGELPFSWRRVEAKPSEGRGVLGMVLLRPRARAWGVARPIRLWAEVTGEGDRR